MKKYFIGMLASAILCSGCVTSRTASGDPGATFAGAAIGGNLGGVIGGLIGESNGGWRGGDRGSAIGTIVGTIAGAAIANAATTPKQKTYDYQAERPSWNVAPSEAEPIPSVLNAVKIHNIRFIDDNRNHAINPGEDSKVVFDITNEGSQTAYNIVPTVSETTGMRHLEISSPLLIERLDPQDGIKYTVNIHAGERLKTGSINIRIAIADEYGKEYDWQEFTLPTRQR
ncbi:MAG: glycine zipper family protein [Bacteroides sp.]|nr:glycine zipper family protein [Bacteroides sp.]